MFLLTTICKILQRKWCLILNNIFFIINIIKKKCKCKILQDKYKYVVNIIFPQKPKSRDFYLFFKWVFKILKISKFKILFLYSLYITWDEKSRDFSIRGVTRKWTWFISRGSSVTSLCMKFHDISFIRLQATVV